MLGIALRVEATIPARFDAFFVLGFCQRALRVAICGARDGFGRARQPRATQQQTETECARKSAATELMTAPSRFSEVSFGVQKSSSIGR